MVKKREGPMTFVDYMRYGTSLIKQHWRKVMEMGMAKVDSSIKRILSSKIQNEFYRPTFDNTLV